MQTHLVLQGATPFEATRYLAEHNPPPTGLLLFDSGKSAQDRALWSILLIDPVAILTERDGALVELPGNHAVHDAATWMQQHTPETSNAPDASDTSRPPFRQGIAGMLGFEFAWQLDDIHAPCPPSSTPALWIGAYDTAACYNHLTHQWHVFTTPESPASNRLLQAITCPRTTPAPPAPATPASPENLPTLTIADDEYCRRVSRCIDEIFAGELFEINYTARFQGTWPGSGFALFDALRSRADGNFGAYLQTEHFTLASVSPERFLLVHDQHITTSPIKGTIRRGNTPEEDQHLAHTLLTSEKDRAENIMIVDLMRNDLTRVCAPGSVHTTALCALESYQDVHHLVSCVEGRLQPGFNALDALFACFPAGSITGAPKLRAIELIAEIEQQARGPYTGSMFYLSDCGRLDSNVLIRTATLVDTLATYGAGGAVVSDSTPATELAEARLKARAFLAALRGEH